MKRLLVILLAAMALAGCAAPFPDANPTATSRRHVLVFGDSLAQNTMGVLPGLDPSNTYYDASRGGSGLLTPIDGLSPLAYFESQVAAHPDVDTVVFEWIGACTVAICPYPFESDAFYDAWFAAQRQMIDAARAHHLAVFWALGPPFPGTNLHTYTDYTQTQAETISWRTRGIMASLGVPTIDWWQALSASDDIVGHYSQWLWYARPGEAADWHQVRQDDFVHLTPDGAYRTARWTIATLSGVSGRE